MIEIPERIVTPPAQSAGRRFLYGAIAVSLLLHAAVGIGLIIEVNRQLPEAEAAPIMVDLVPPPEPEEPELVLPEEIAPGPEAAEEPPPPPPQELPQSEEELAGTPSSLPVMKPVVEFGEEESGPKISPDGVSEQEPEEPEPEEPQSREPVVAEAEAEQEPDAESAESELAETAETLEELNPDPSEIPEPAPEPRQVAEAEPAPEILSTDTPGAILVPPEQKPAPDVEAAERDEIGELVEMTTAQQLFSEAITGDERARTAMKNMSRSERGSLLCMTELRGQLLAASPPRPPEVLPSYELPPGTVLETRRAAFRSRGQWFDLAFRCEVNDDVTKIVNFSFRVGDAIPREQWSQRGFPSL